MPGNDRKQAASAPSSPRVRGGSPPRLTRKGQMRAMSDDGAGARGPRSPAGNAAGDRARSRAVSREEVASVKRQYRAVFERGESGAWTARVPSVRGCHTYGRTLDQARRRLREALALWVDEPDKAELVEDVRLPANVKAAVRASRADRRRAEEQRAEASASTTRAARALVHELGVGFRDAAELLGVSHQRVQQLVRG